MTARTAAPLPDDRRLPVELPGCAGNGRDRMIPGAGGYPRHAQPDAGWRLRSGSLRVGVEE
jgi:hypothetical protein